MPDIARDLGQLLRDDGARRAADEQFVRLRDFLKERQERGLVIKKEYELPPLDTVGRTAHRADK